MKQNYQLILNKTLKEIQGLDKRPKLLLHVCCAPCSSYVLEYLSGFFDITLFFYNPNIAPEAEFTYREAELKRLISEMPLNGPVRLETGAYEPEKFYAIAKGLEDMDEGGERCFKCYELRLRESAEAAKKGGYDYFTTTLSISPHKNAQKLNEIGAYLAEEYGIQYLHSDFKKKGGYKRSCELSTEYSLYRQSYCGCAYSKAQAVREGRI